MGPQNSEFQRLAAFGRKVPAAQVQRAARAGPLGGLIMRSLLLRGAQILRPGGPASPLDALAASLVTDLVVDEGVARALVASAPARSPRTR